ncbi:MAG: methyltransferase [Eubacterium sp.]|nr:methyltransferase [Eubacterium sp.]
MTEVNEKFSLGGIDIFVSKDHRFGTDAFLLADFAAPLPNHTVCDLCTGCGIIPLLFCREKPPRKVYGIDISEEAIELFQNSVRHNGLSDRVTPLLCDLKDISVIERESCDIVTVNPPYFKKDSGGLKLSPAQAAARTELLCNINDVTMAAAKLLKYGGSLKMCHIPARLSDVVCAMRAAGIEPKLLQFVVKKQGEKPWLFLISGKRGAKPGMDILPQLAVYDENMEYTEQIKKMYLIKDVT